MQEFKLDLVPQDLSASDVGNIIFDYFTNLKETKQKPTVAGLALVLNYPPQKLFKYVEASIDNTVQTNEQEKAQLISRALAHIAEHYEEGGDIKRNSTFNWNMLKALGYPEKTTVDHTIEGLSLVELAKQAKQIRESEQENTKNLSPDPTSLPIEGEIVAEGDINDEENQ